MAVLFVSGATYAGLRATKSAPGLRGTLILAGLLASLLIGSSASFRLRLLLMEPIGPATVRDILEIWMVAVASVLAARAGGESAVGTRSVALSLAVAFVVPISFLAGARAFRARPIAAVVALGPGIADAVGGGFTAAGLWGDYFGNPGFAGPPAFSQRDVRIDFDWGLAGRPGGSTSPGFDAVGHDGFSVRWTGRVVARFGEPYTFDVDSDDDVRLWLRDKGSGRWTALVDRRQVDVGAGAGGRVASVPVQLTAGVPVEMKLEYRRSSGPARIRLFWASPSTPREIIEPLSASGVNVAGLPGYVGYLGSALLADAMQGGRRQWTEPDRDGLVPLDRDGWPLRDSDNITIEGGTQTRGIPAQLRRPG
jgi:hypothetical protein